VRTAPQQIAAAIKQEILDGTLKPGDKLPPELDLAELFGVSRPTVRAGLQELCAREILTVQRGRNGGYRVAELSLEALEASVRDFLSLSLVVETLKPSQFLEVRYAVELLVAETAARARSFDRLRQLETLAATIEAGGHAPRKAFELDLEFHRLMAEATENPLILTFERAMIAVLHSLIGDGASVSPDHSLGNIPDIVTAVREHDAGAAREAMHEHLMRSAAYYGLRAKTLASDVRARRHRGTSFESRPDRVTTELPGRQARAETLEQLSELTRMGT
jgi:DNA-binding FadR family transcriptional regulator